MELCSTLFGSLDEKGVLGRMDTCICMAESLHCSPETNTTLLMGYILIQNQKFIIEKKKTSHNKWNKQTNKTLPYSFGNLESHALPQGCAHAQERTKRALRPHFWLTFRLHESKKWKQRQGVSYLLECWNRALTQTETTCEIWKFFCDCCCFFFCI